MDTDYIFRGSVDYVKFHLLHCDREVGKENVELIEFYRKLIRLRHDLLHYCVLFSLGREWTNEQTMTEALQIEDSNDLLRRTPDIVHHYLNTILLIDVSVSRDIKVYELLKTDRYLPVCQYLNRQYKLDASFIHINVSTSLRNLETELHKLNKYIKQDFPMHFFSECNEILEDKKKWVSQFVDREFFEQSMQDFSLTQTAESLGLYSDLEIDYDVFKTFNDKFTLEKNIEDNLANNNEEDFIKYLGVILENPSCQVFQKYADSRCTPEQFDFAMAKIKQENDMRPKVNPKPSHHIVVPKYENIFPCLKGVNSEQEMLKSLFSYIAEIDTSCIEPIYHFVQGISQNCLNLFDYRNKNKDYNDEIFNTGHVKVDENDSLNNLFRELGLIYHFKEEEDIKQWSKQLKRRYSITSENFKEKIKMINERKNYLLNKYKYNPLDKKNYSYLEFLKDNNILKEMERDVDVLAVKQKCFFLKMNTQTQGFQAFWRKTGINSFKNLPEENKEKVDSTIQFESHEIFDKMLKHLMQKNDRLATSDDYFFDKYFDYQNVFDEENARSMKKELTESYLKAFELLRDTNTYDYLYKSRFICQQLLHFSMLNLKPNTFSVFNAGIPNFCYVVAGCYNKLFSESGKPFMCFGITNDPDYYSEFFGKITKVQINDKWLVMSNWRRLPTFKLTHIKDAYYSVVSTTMNSILSARNELSISINGKVDSIFALRCCIALCTNQRISEILMDNRYAYVSAYSSFTNIQKLLIEKFKPPFRCVFECWLVNRILKRLPIINKNATPKNIKLKSPEYFNHKRVNTSVGGKIRMPSLWFDFEILDINEVLDEAFIYVHTLKEPSNTYHEYVSAIKTIIDYQQAFDSLSLKRQTGCLSITDLDDFLLDDIKIGCYTPCVFWSTKKMLFQSKPNFKKIINNINDEPISEIISTKAVISDLDRELKSDKILSNRQTSKKLKKIKQYQGIDVQIQDKMKEYVLSTHSKYYGPYKPRQRVFETILDLVESNTTLSKTINLAEYFIKKEDGEMLADICIKAQYGSKREFYVINIGATALARCMENFYREISEQNIHEAISIPGDKKMLAMQNMLNRIYASDKLTPDSKIMFVNGDCTKWSAAETMSSFIAMTLAFKGEITPKMYEMIIATFNVWSKKEIQIPVDILNKTVKPRMTKAEKFKFLDPEVIKNAGKIRSTQNFLQGMFNYSSSYKAVCCTNYTYQIWQKLYPNTTLYLEHMEHSDDYVLVVIYQDIEDFIKFRVLHKIMMRFHGYSDSERKTNCQHFLMEFVSLISYNGVMLYPQIKKTKEINMNLPCVGFKTDIEAAYSRVGECMRVGCTQSFLYFFQRMHNLCVAEAYSLLPGMTNAYSERLFDMLNTPIELFGLPDMLPLFSLFCKGNGNNYRLYQYGDEKVKTKIRKLYKLALKVETEEKYMSENIDFAYSLFHGKFYYEFDNKNILKLRRAIEWDNESLQNFWRDHISYKLLKPRNVELLVPWLKSMFFNRSFVEAYTKSSRTKMSMRISKFVKNRIIKMFIKSEELQEKYLNNLSEVYNIKEYLNTVNKNLNDMGEVSIDEIQLLKIITKCDPTYSAIYTTLKNIRIEAISSTHKLPPQIAIKTPIKIGSYEIVNSPETIIKYIFNNQEFYKYKRKTVSEQSLEMDIALLKERIPEKQLLEPTTMSILSIYNDLRISQENQIVTMGYNYNSTTLLDQICDIYTYNYHPHRKCKVTIHGVIHVVDPFTNKTLYLKGQKLMPDMHQQCVENLCLLYTYLRYKEKRGLVEIRKIFDEIQFVDKEYNVKLTSRDVLCEPNTSILETFKTDHHHMKLQAYLSASIYGDNTLLNELANSIYSYSYKYLTRANYIGERYIGETIGNFSHMNKAYKFTTFKEDNTKIALICTQPNYKLLNMHYNIALKLTDNINEIDFLKEPMKNNIRMGNYFENEEDYKVFIKKHHIINVYFYDQDKIHYKNAKDFKYNEKCLPLFKSVTEITTLNDKRGKLHGSKPTIKEDKLCVFLGKEKMFMLPVWKCKQYNNMEYNGFDKIIKILIVKGNLHNYFHNEELHIPQNSKPLEIDYEKMKKDLINGKIYDFYDKETINYLLPTPVLKSKYNDLFQYKNEFLTQPEVNLTIEPKEQIDKPKLTSIQELSELLSLDLQPIKTVKDLSGLFDTNAIDDFILDDYVMDDFETPGHEQEDLFPELLDDFQSREFQNMFLKQLSIGYEMSASDLIVQKPTKKYKPWYRRVNYVLSKINLLPHFEFFYNKCIYLNDKKAKYMKLHELLHNLKTQFELHYITNNNLCYYNIYELLCNTYVKAKFEKDETLYTCFDNKITIQLTKEILNPTQEMIMKIKQSPKLIHQYMKGSNAIVILKVEMKVFIDTCLSKFGIQKLDFLKDEYPIKLLTNFQDIESLL
jgi:hypothetical protein